MKVGMSKRETLLFNLATECINTTGERERKALDLLTTECNRGKRKISVDLWINRAEIASYYDFEESDMEFMFED